MYPCVSSQRCSSSAALHPPCFYCNRNPQKCPGYPPTVSYRRKTSYRKTKKKPLQDFFFLSFQWAFLVRSICWLVCVSELVWPRLLFRWWEIDYNTLGFTDFWTRFCLQMREQLHTDAWTLASISKTKVNSTLRLLCFFLSLWIALFFLKTFHGSLIMS